MKKLIITENDKEYIKSLYGILNEQKTPQVSNDSALFSKMKASNNYHWEQDYSNTNETDEKKIEEAKQLSLKALFNKLSSNKDRYNESSVCYIITKLEGRYKSVAYIHKDSIDGVNHGCFDENAPKASTEKLIPKSTTTTTTIQSPITPELNKNDWTKIPNWLIGNPMNFYEKKEQTDYPLNTTITNIIGYWPRQGEFEFGMTDVSYSSSNGAFYNFNILRFKCNEQNEDLGQFLFKQLDDKHRYGQTFWNKTIAEKYFAPYFCSKNNQGRWVPKVENPDFSQTSTNKQPRIV